VYGVGGGLHQIEPPPPRECDAGIAWSAKSQKSFGPNFTKNFVLKVLLL